MERIADINILSPGIACKKVANGMELSRSGTSFLLQPCKYRPQKIEGIYIKCHVILHGKLVQLYLQTLIPAENSLLLLKVSAIPRSEIFLSTVVSKFTVSGNTGQENSTFDRDQPILNGLSSNQ